MPPTLSFHYPLQSPRVQDVFQSVSNGRRSWKSLRGGEIVWPPELEAALFEGLENYQPDDSRETRLLGRFPLRNRFISEWIFEKTGKRRTAKQIGSRLQQLKDTSRGRRFLTLFSLNRPPYRPTSLVSDELRHKDSHDPPSRRCESDSSSDSSESFPTTPIEAYTTLQNLFLDHGVESREDEMPNTIVYIDLLCPDHSISVDSSLKSSGQVAEEHSWVERGYKIIRATQYPRHLCDIDPTITLLSHSMTNARSYFTVYSEDRLIFSESTILEVVDSASNVDGVLYKTSLVPGLWDVISQSSDASQYTIIQRVIQDSSSTSPTIFYSLYKFVYQTSSSTEPNAFISPMLAPESVVQNSDLSFETMLSIEADTYPDMVDFAKSPNIFDLDFALAPAKWSPRCSQAQSVVSSPIHYPQSMSNIILDVDEQLLSPASSFDETDIVNYP